MKRMFFFLMGSYINVLFQRKYFCTKMEHRTTINGFELFNDLSRLSKDKSCIKVLHIYVSDNWANWNRFRQSVKKDNYLLLQVNISQISFIIEFKRTEFAFKAKKREFRIKKVPKNNVPNIMLFVLKHTQTQIANLVCTN